MLQENELVPFEAKPLLGERLLVLAPHPDDEALGCGGLVALHARAGRQVLVVVATDGTAADLSLDPAASRARRERETLLGLEQLGVAQPARFLGLPDRQLASNLDSLRDSLREILLREKPDLIAAPSPVELHPDHVALARALFDLLHGDPALRSTLPPGSVAFYEVSQPLQPNTLVDITSVAEAKDAAIACHASQTGLRDYGRFIRGLNEFRTMTLGADARVAEAYRVLSLDEIRSTPWSDLCASLQPRWKGRLEPGAEPLPITVVIRTRDRHNWLREAVASVLAGEHPAEIVVVNDGGASPREWLTAMSPAIRLVEHTASKGRSEAMNAGVREATTEWIAFLDDDDLYYPEHLATLAAAARTGNAVAYYSDALYVSYTAGPDGALRETSRARLFQTDFDADLLLVDNYIPLPTLLVRRADFLGAGGFDPALDLFEDWDFLIRLSRRGRLQRTPRVTCEVRTLPGSGSIVGASPEGSAAYRDAKARVWEKHRALIGFDTLEGQKRRLVASATRSLEAEGRAAHLEHDVARLEREKNVLIAEIGAKHGEAEHERISHAATRGTLEAAESRTRSLEADAAALGERLSRLRDEMRASQEELQRCNEELQRRNGECVSLRAMLDEHRIAVEKQTATINDLFREIERLNGTIDAIHRSRLWKLKQSLGRLTGRG